MLVMAGGGPVLRNGVVELGHMEYLVVKLRTPVRSGRSSTIGTMATEKPYTQCMWNGSGVPCVIIGKGRRGSVNGYEWQSEGPRGAGFIAIRRLSSRVLTGEGSDGA